jgi:hypothetical protein
MPVNFYFFINLRKSHFLILLMHRTQGVQIDTHLNWKCHIDQILPKLSNAGFVIRQLFYILDLKTLRMAHFSCFH